MSNKFDAVPEEDDTLILAQIEADLDGYDALYQKWQWDGITAESIIFLTSDVSALSEDEIKVMVCSSPIVTNKESITFKEADSGYTFVNFNFVTE